MVTKIVTSVVITVCCTILGTHMSNRYVNRIREIRTIQSALSQLETEILYYSNFLPEALERVGRAIDGELSRFFLDVADRLKSRTGYTVAEAWKSALKEYRRHLSIGRQEYEILYRFSEYLGVGDRESQQKYIQIIQHQLKGEERNADELRSKYQRMYRSLGVLLGLALAIILF